jgi:hypothetical protein
MGGQISASLTERKLLFRAVQGTAEIPQHLLIPQQQAIRNPLG